MMFGELTVVLQLPKLQGLYVLLHSTNQRGNNSLVIGVMLLITLLLSGTKYGDEFILPLKCNCLFLPSAFYCFYHFAFSLHFPLFLWNDLICDFCFLDDL